MELHALPHRTQDYLKVLWDLGEHSGGQPVPLGAIAAKLEQKAPTASEAIKRLAAQGLVDHQRYLGVTLTAQGRELAIAMVRRHRLIETFLVEILGYTWDEVHGEADTLEHSCSERFINCLDDLLGRPERDPHGDPIPSREGAVEDLGTRTLADVAVGASVTIERFCDNDPELLRYADENGLQVGMKVTVTDVSAGLISVTAGDASVALAQTTGANITVR